MNTTIEQRKRRADERSQPVAYFSYVLQFDDDQSFYVGSTNAPLARFSEHAIGVGAKATQGRAFKIRLVLPFLSRKEAEYNESRLQQALAKGPDDLKVMLDVFDRMINIVRPQKTFSELRQEEEDNEREMRTVMHHSVAVIGSGGYTPTACGYPVTHYSTNDWDVIKKMARDEDFTGNIYGRKVCRRCVALAPD